MRISDWSSDVGSSDLGVRLELLPDVIALALHRLAIFARDAGEVVEAIVDGDHDRVAVVEVAGRAGPKRLVAIRIGDRRGAHVAVDLRDQRGAAFRVEEAGQRSEEHTSELQSLMRISYAGFCLKKKNIIVS